MLLQSEVWTSGDQCTMCLKLSERAEMPQTETPFGKERRSKTSESHEALVVELMCGFEACRYGRGATA